MRPIIEELERRPNLPEPAPEWVVVLGAYLAAFVWVIAVFWMAG